MKISFYGSHLSFSDKRNKLNFNNFICKSIIMKTNQGLGKILEAPSTNGIQTFAADVGSVSLAAAKKKSQVAEEAGAIKRGTIVNA